MKNRALLEQYLKFFVVELNYESSKTGRKVLTLSEIWSLTDQLAVNFVYLAFGAVLHTGSANHVDEISERERRLVTYIGFSL